MLIPYVYEIKNKITGQFYYGSRSKNVKLKLTPAEDLWKVYFTSSIPIKELINIYGEDSFEIKIIFKNEDYKICYWYEQLCIRNSIHDNLSLNFHFIDPDNELECFSTFGKKPSKQTTDKIIQTKQRNGTLKGGHISELHKKKISLARTGMKFSDETRLKMSQVRKGSYCWVYKNETIRIKIEHLEKYLLEGWLRGRKIIS